MRDGEFEPDDGIRLGAREVLDDPELPEPELGGFDSPPPELELVELEPPEPPELDPDDPELDEPEELPRGTACAPATPGAARTKATTRLSARRVDLGMVVSRGSWAEPPPRDPGATLLPLQAGRKCPVSREL